MLVQLSNISGLDVAAKARMMAASQHLLHTNEARNGYVTFEGKFYSVESVKFIIQPQNAQFLTEG
jgi:hypothetical protein